MKEELTQQLHDKYPSLYRDKNTNKVICGIACEDGWLLLIDVLSDLIVGRSTDIKAGQIKEKFGGLRFYVDGCKKKDIDYILGVITMSEIISMFVCEICCLKGAKRGIYSNSTRCELHSDEPEQPEHREVDLPFEVHGIGKMWLKMVTNFYRYIEMNRHIHKNLVITKVAKEDGRLVVEIDGGNDITYAMVKMLLAYANKIDEHSRAALL